MKSPVRKRGAKRVYRLNKRSFTTAVCRPVHTAFDGKRYILPDGSTYAFGHYIKFKIKLYYVVSVL